MFKILLFIAIAASSCVYAGSMDYEQCLDNGWAFTINVGPAWSNAGQTQTLTLQPDIEKAYIADKSSKTLLNGEFFIGYQHSLFDNIFGQFGVTYGFTNNVKLSGSVWEDADPDFNNFSYQYNVFLNHISIKGKLLAQLTPTLFPYIGGSIGKRGYNHSTNYSESAYIPEEVPPPPFTDGSINNILTYSAEIGIQKALNKNVYVGIGYNYSDWGKSSLGRAQGQTTTSVITVDNFYTSGVQLNLTFVG
jgi:opacity protein-like surface antigen